MDKQLLKKTNAIQKFLTALVMSPTAIQAGGSAGDTKKGAGPTAATKTALNSRTRHGHITQC